MVPDTEVLTRAGIPSIHTLLQKAQARWAGHVTRMPADRLPNSSYMVSSATENDQLVGKRNASRTPLRRPSKSSTLMSPTGKLCAQDRPQWRSMIHTGARTSETHSIAEAQKKRASRKARLYSTSSTSAGPTYPCPECGRALLAKIGLISHLRTHRVNETGHHHHHRRSYGHHRKR